MFNIVCHSMGFAYALGIIDVFKIRNIKIGRLYIIAPENASSGNITPGDYEEVWQYGSNLGMDGADPLCQQDGVAPQTYVGGLPANNRVTTPKNAGFTKSFVESHRIANYKWIFQKTVNDPGYVKTRK